MQKSFELFDGLVDVSALQRVTALGAEQRSALAMSLARETSWWRSGATANMQLVQCEALERGVVSDVTDVDWIGLICASGARSVSVALGPHMDRGQENASGEALIALRPDRLVLFDPARIAARVLNRQLAGEVARIVLISASNRDRSS
ncbi:hypothetical protein ACE102_25360 [Bradyrhizobium sp. vgs-9]|uniref:hypothetical protein n=1 Tax=Bradyrhizobium sp. vgs-9 TaxID=208389 RepID=UPI0035D48C1F